MPKSHSYCIYAVRTTDPVMAKIESNKEPANVTIYLRAQRWQRELIDQAASLLGQKRSDFILDVVCREAESVVLNSNTFIVNADTWANFNALLDAPPRPLSELRKLLLIKAPWDEQ